MWRAKLPAVCQAGLATNWEKDLAKLIFLKPKIWLASKEWGNEAIRWLWWGCQFPHSKGQKWKHQLLDVMPQEMMRPLNFFRCRDDDFFWRRMHWKKTSLVRDEFSLTLQGTNISHRGKRKIIFKSALEWDMLVPRSVSRKPVDRQDDHRFEDSFGVSLLVIHDHLDQTGNLVSVLGRKRPKQNLHLPGWSNVGAVFPSKRSGKNLMMCFFSGILDGEPLKVLDFLWFEGFPKSHTQSFDAKKPRAEECKDDTTVGWFG